MSNTTDISPYDDDEPVSSSSSGYESWDSGASSSSGGVCAAACDAVRWLCEVTDEDRAAVARAKGVQRNERLRAFFAQGQAPRITAARLTLTALDPLLQSARNLGYKVQPLTSQASSSSLFLQKGTGEWLAISRDRGRLVVRAAGDMRQVHALMRQHTQDRVLEHLGKRMGMDIRAARLANGEIQISARETSLRHSDGQAVMKAQVRQDGGLWVDVDGIRSNRCERVVADLAEAMGGEITAMKKKAAAFTLPGEPTKTAVRV